MIEPTTTDLQRVRDVIVIGAGPAGSLAARLLAIRGLDVLLVDRADFPRSKVCGGCLNADALATLDRAGLRRLPESVGAAPLDRLDIITRGRHCASIPLAGGCVVSRREFDAALIAAAVDSGADFVPSCAATVADVQHGLRTLRLGTEVGRAGLVIVADGLAGSSLAGLHSFTPRTSRRSRIGLGGMVAQAPGSFARNAVTMICGSNGYLGAAWLGDERLDVAAAVDPGWLKRIGGPEAAIASFLADAGTDAPIHAAWRGTPALSRRRCVADERLMVIGDAAGFVEPFTGEGMAWAMAGAEAAAELASRAFASGLAVDPASWTDAYRRLILRRQRECRWIARLLRRPVLTSLATRVLAGLPAVATSLVHRINRRESTGAVA